MTALYVLRRFKALSEGVHERCENLQALVPKPRGNLIRFHWVFAPNSTSRSGSQYA